MASRYLLDSNHLGKAIRRSSTLYREIVEASEKGDRFGTCIPVLCEIEVGLGRVDHPERYRASLNHHLEHHLKLWPLERSTAQVYGITRNELRAAGRQLSQVDTMLAAIARELGLTLLTTDRDFEAFDDIKTENWT